MALINFDKHMFEVINIEDKPYFYGSQIAKFLEYARPGIALETHVSRENKTRVRNLDPAQRVLLNEIGVYEQIFGSQMPLAKELRDYVFGTIIPAFRKSLIDNQPVIEQVKQIKPIGNQLTIINEFDLQVKIVSFLRNYYPDVLFSATQEELQDTPNKRITCNIWGSASLHQGNKYHRLWFFTTLYFALFSTLKHRSIRTTKDGFRLISVKRLPDAKT